MATRILIASRGISAIRVARSLIESGYAPVGIYTRDDENSPHRKYLVEDREVSSYLDIEDIVEVAVEMGVEAVHPGYSVLGSNPEFAREVARRGMVFIGPPPSMIELAGDDVALKILAERVEVPALPWSEVRKPDDILEFASVHGYPVVVKTTGVAASGNYKIVHSSSEVEKAVESLKKDIKAVDRGVRVFVEPYLDRVKHIEVQVLGDGDNIVHLFDREYIVQRSEQRLLDEAPSPILTRNEREKILECALALAMQLKYKNTGVFTFLYDIDKREFYVSGFRAGLQPEHVVTEMITRIDIVRKQVEISLYGVLDLKQSSIDQHGHSIGVSILAENPLSGEISEGVITKYREPSGLGVRVDSSIVENYKVTAKHDPLLAKLAVWAPTRILAVSRLKRALNDYVIEGVSTNIMLIKHIVSSDEFNSGNYTTRLFNEKEKYFRELTRESLELQSATLIALLELGVKDAKKIYEKKTSVKETSRDERISRLKRSAWYYYTILKHSFSTQIKKSRGTHLKPK